MVGDTPVKATISGVIRGLIRDGYPVFEGMKIADIDQGRTEEKLFYDLRQGKVYRRGSSGGAAFLRSASGNRESCEE